MCEHNNKKMIRFEFSNGIHMTKYQCIDCNEQFYMMDSRFIYNYPPVYVMVGNTFINIEDLIVLGNKSKLLKK